MSRKLKKNDTVEGLLGILKDYLSIDFDKRIVYFYTEKASADFIAQARVILKQDPAYADFTFYYLKSDDQLYTDDELNNYWS